MAEKEPAETPAEKPAISPAEIASALLPRNLGVKVGILIAFTVMGYPAIPSANGVE